MFGSDFYYDERRRKRRREERRKRHQEAADRAKKQQQQRNVIAERYNSDKTLPMRVVLNKEEHLEPNELGLSWIEWAVEADEAAALAYLMRPELRAYGGEHDNTIAFRVLSRATDTWGDSFAMRMFKEHPELCKEVFTGKAALIHRLAATNEKIAREILQNFPELWNFKIPGGLPVISYIFKRQYSWTREEALSRADVLSQVPTIEYEKTSVLEEVIYQDYGAEEEVLKNREVALKEQLSGRYLIETLMLKRMNFSFRVLQNKELALTRGSDGNETLAHKAIKKLREEDYHLVLEDLDIAGQRDNAGTTVAEKLVRTHKLGWEQMRVYEKVLRIKNKDGGTLAAVVAEIEPTGKNKLNSMVFRLKGLLEEFRGGRQPHEEVERSRSR